MSRQSFSTAPSFLPLISHHQDRTLLRELWEHFPEPMFLIRVESPERFVVEAVNPAQQAAIGYSCAGLPIEQLLPDPEQARSVIGHYRESLILNRPIRYEEVGHFHKESDESLNWLTLLVPLHDDHGNITHLLGISQNITELRLARLALETQNARLEVLVEERTAELRASNERLAMLASRDELTGIANRRQLTFLTEQAMRLARRQHTPLALLILDINNFKTINDTRGHLAGDTILREVAQTLNKTLRESDLLGRFGGDEFVVVLPNTCAEDAHHLAERLRTAVAQHCGCSISLGIADFTPHDDFSSLVERADRVLLRAKRASITPR